MRRPSTVHLVAIAAGWLLVSGAWAADMDALKSTTPAERAKAQTAMMKTKLGLTEAQTPKVAELNLRYAERMDPIIKGSSPTLVKMRETRGIQEEKERELKGLLSPEQFEKYLAAKEEMRGQLVERMREQRGGK